METIRIGDKHYNAETLTEGAKALLGDLQKIEGRMGQLSLDASIMDLAKQTLIGKLVEETANLTEVPAPVQTEGTEGTTAAPTPVAQAPAVNPAPAPAAQ